MDDIPGIVWVIVGGFVSLVSLFMGFLRPVTYSAFFKLMFVVGIGMLVYGYIFKIKMNEKSTREILEDRRQKNFNLRTEMEADIDMDDYRNDPRKREEVLRRGYPSTARNMNQRYGYGGGQAQQQPGAYNNPTYQPQRQQMPQQQQQPPYSGMRKQIQKQGIPQGKFCTGCGTPLLKEHKYCPICGARV